MKRGGPFISCYLQAMCHWFNFHLPVVGMGFFMVVAVVDHRPYFETHRGRGTAQTVLDIGCIGSRLHPDALFQQGIGQIIAGAVELSNTDIGKNLIDLILASTAYRGNTRVIDASQRLLEELLKD
ncbi:MAG: hypothetical protein HUU01_23725, partial [Saprospiraceae bacterium]|nr:hypothetical protein [Saprospiraceae bacterium]